MIINYHHCNSLLALFPRMPCLTTAAHKICTLVEKCLTFIKILSQIYLTDHQTVLWRSFEANHLECEIVKRSAREEVYVCAQGRDGSLL